MRALAVFLVAATAAFAGPIAKAQPLGGPISAPDGEARKEYAITDPQGTVIGFQREFELALSESTVMRTRTRELSYSIDGHEPMRQSVTVNIAASTVDSAPAFYGVTYGNGRSSVSYLVTFDKATARIDRKAGDQESTTTQTITPGIPIHDPEMIAVAAPTHFYSFDPGLGRLVERHSNSVPMKSAAGSQRSAILTYDADRPINVWIAETDRAGEIVAMTLPQVGSHFRFTLQIAPAPGAEAERSGKISHPMLDSPNAISASAKKGHIRYRVSLLEALARSIPQTPEQRITLTPEGMQMDVCQGCGEGFASDPASLEQWRRPARWLQSDFPAIAKAGGRIARRDASDAEKLRQLSRLTRRRLKDIDLNGHYSARAAWNRRAGDCTEDAVLLAALARAAGIPARVASGLAYTRERYHGARDAFIPHAWVIAYLDGQWRSFDMTTKEGFGAGHLALTIGDGAPQDIAAANLIAGMIEWRSLSEVRKRPRD